MSQSDLERANAYNASVVSAIRGELAFVWTALPGEIVSFNADLQTAQVQPTIQAEVTDANGVTTLATLPLLLDCPVHFPRGGGCILTFPVKPGDECIVVFSSRCLDAWWQTGGVQPQAELRMHDLSDGFVFVGVASRPNAVADVSMAATELRSLDGSTLVSLDPEAQTLALTAPGGATINANTIINGTLHVTGAISTDDDVIAGAITLKTHRTPGITAGGAIAGAPVP